MLVLSGSLFRRKVAFAKFKNWNSNTNPRKGGPYHFKAPSKILWWAIRGMIPHKTKKGKIAMERLKIFEGCPYPYSHRKRKVIPRALKVIRLLKNRKYCILGELSSGIGWNKGKILLKLEN